MIVGLLISAIGIIPIVLAFCVNRLYKDSNLSLGLLFFMLLVFIWQESVSILYYKDILNEHEALIFFRVFRLAPTFQIPVVFYIAYIIIKVNSTTFKNDSLLHQLINFIFTKKMLIILTFWSFAIYLITFTKYGIKGLKVEQASFSPIEFYFPEYGALSWLYSVHMVSLIIFLVFLLYISTKIYNKNIRSFLKGFTIYSLLLFLLGTLNFNPETGMIAGSFGVIIFSVMVLFEFIKLDIFMKINYFQLFERQKKLDFVGSQVGSLIHEVKNINIIVKGFSKMLHKDSSNLNERQRSSIDMILQATEQVEDLANNYKEYMKNSKMDFKMEDIGEIIKQSIDFSRESLNEKQVAIEFNNKYNPLKAFVNKTYLQQVFINLIKNSTEAISKDKEDRKITIKTELIDDMITIHFYDTGKGIPLENWESIFDPFISFKDKGMGLGLAFVKKILFEHRGDIVVADSTPAGTHFKITIPQFGIHYIH